MTENSPLPENEAASTIGKRVDRLDRMLQNQQFLVEALIKSILNNFPNNENDSFKKEVENLNKRYQDINQEIISDTGRFSAYDTISSQTQNLFKTIEAEIKQIKEDNSQLNSSERQLEIENIKTDLEGLQKQVETISGTETDKSSKTSFSVLKSAVTTKVDKMKNSLKAYESKTNKEISSLREMVFALEASNQSYQTEFRNLNSRIQSYQLKFNYIQDQLLTTEEKDKMMNEIQNMKNQLNSFKHASNEIDDFVSKIEVIKTKQSEIPIIKANQEKTIQDIEELRQELNQLKENPNAIAREAEIDLDINPCDDYDQEEEDGNNQVEQNSQQEEDINNQHEEDNNSQNDENHQEDNIANQNESQHEEDNNDQNEENNEQTETQNEETSGNELDSIKAELKSLKSSQSKLFQQVNQIRSRLSKPTKAQLNNEEKQEMNYSDFEDRLQLLEDKIEKLEQNTDEPIIRTRDIQLDENDNSQKNVIDDMNRTIQSLKTRIQKLEANLNTTNDSFNALKLATTSMKDIVIQKGTKVDELQGTVQKLKGSKDDALSEEMKLLMNEIRTEVKQIEDEIARMKSSADEASANTIKSQTKLNKLQKQMADIKESNERNNKAIKEFSEQLEKGTNEDLSQKVEGLESLYQLMYNGQTTLISNNRNISQSLTNLHNMMNENKARIERLESDLETIQCDVSLMNKSSSVNTKNDLSSNKLDQKSVHDIHCLKYELKKCKHDLQCVKYELKKLKHQDINIEITETPKERSIDVNDQQLPMSPFRDTDDLPKKFSKLYVEVDKLKKNILSWPSSIEDLQNQINTIQEQVNNITK